MTDEKEVKARVRSTARTAQKKAEVAQEAVARELDLDVLEGVSPIIVGFVRGLIHAAVMGASGFRVLADR